MSDAVVRFVRDLHVRIYDMENSMVRAGDWQMGAVNAKGACMVSLTRTFDALHGEFH